MNKTSYSTDELLSKIDNLRKQMISKGKTKGISHPETLEISEKLDMLIYKFQKLIIKISFISYIPSSF
jgi:stage 0 sporulation regulatory protein